MTTSTPQPAPVSGGEEVDPAEIGSMRDEFATRLHAEWCGCDSWDGVNCEDYHEREFREQADAVMPVVVEALSARDQEIDRLRAENRGLRGRILRAKTSLNDFMAGEEWARLVAALAALADRPGVSETPEATDGE